MNNEFSLESIKGDLKYQLATSNDLDWDYFLETAIRAKQQADLEHIDMVFDGNVHAVQDAVDSILGNGE